MAKTKKTNKTVKTTTNRDVNNNNTTYFEKLETDIKSNQNTLSLILGALIVIVVGVLIFNYFNRQSEPQIATEDEQNTITAEGDVSPENLPGKYTVKEGDTLFTIAQKYYSDGYKYSEIVAANEIANENTVSVGQVLEIPKIEGVQAQAEASASPAATEAPVAEATNAPTAAPQAQADAGTGGQEVTPGQPADTAWGQAIRGDSYTVVEGDWLSTIAARAYGDVLSYEKIAQANNISNPDVIAAGTVLKLPR